MDCQNHQHLFLILYGQRLWFCLVFGVIKIVDNRNIFLVFKFFWVSILRLSETAVTPQESSMEYFITGIKPASRAIR